MEKHEIFVQGEGLKKIELVRVEKSSTVRSLLEATAAKGLVIKDEGEKPGIFLENSDEELDADSSLEKAGIHHRSRVHVHRCRKVHVTVNFKEKQAERDFPPSTTIHHVKKWAVSEAVFNLSEVDASEHILQICGSNDRPDEDVHLGTLVTFPNCKVCFDLVAKMRVEG